MAATPQAPQVADELQVLEDQLKDQLQTSVQRGQLSPETREAFVTLKRALDRMQAALREGRPIDPRDLQSFQQQVQRLTALMSRAREATTTQQPVAQPTGTATTSQPSRPTTVSPAMAQAEELRSRAQTALTSGNHAQAAQLAQELIDHCHTHHLNDQNNPGQYAVYARARMLLAEARLGQGSCQEALAAIGPLRSDRLTDEARGESRTLRARSMAGAFQNAIRSGNAEDISRYAGVIGEVLRSDSPLKQELIAQLRANDQGREVVAQWLRNAGQEASGMAGQATNNNIRMEQRGRAIEAYEILREVSPADAVTANQRLGQLYTDMAMSLGTWQMATPHQLGSFEDIQAGRTPTEQPDSDRTSQRLNNILASQSTGSRHEDLVNHCWDQAARAYQSVVQANPNDGEARYHLGRIQNMQGQPQQAVQNLEVAASNRPNDPDVHMELAISQAQQGQWATAMTSMERALTAETQGPERRDSRQRMSQMLVAFSEVRYQVAAHSNQAGTNPQAYTREINEAIALNRRALEYSPNNPQATANIERLQTLADPRRAFDMLSRMYQEDSAANADHAAIFYARMASAGEDPNSPRQVRESWTDFQQKVSAIPNGHREHIPISYFNSGTNQTQHIPLVGGETTAGHYRIVDPLTNRTYEGTSRREAMQQFLASPQYPAGSIRYQDESGALQTRQLSYDTTAIADSVADVWAGVSTVAMAASLIPPLAPVAGPIAASGVIPAAYMAGRTIHGAVDRVQHGQGASWDTWMMETTQVLGAALGVGGLASGLSSTARTLSQAQRAASIQRYLLAANLTTDVAAVPAIVSQLMAETSRPGISDMERRAAISRTIFTLALSTGMNVRNIRAMGGHQGMARLAQMDEPQFNRLMQLAPEERQAALGLNQQAFRRYLELPDATARRNFLQTQASPTTPRTTRPDQDTATQPTRTPTSSVPAETPSPQAIRQQLDGDILRLPQQLQRAAQQKLQRLSPQLQQALAALPQEQRLAVLTLRPQQITHFLQEMGPIQRQRVLELVRQGDTHVEHLFPGYRTSPRNTSGTYDSGTASQVPEAPPVSCGSQGKHLVGHPSYTRLQENGQIKSAWAQGADHIRLTQEAWLHGEPVPGQPQCRVFRCPSPVGSQGEAWIKVHMDDDGLIHGHPLTSRQHGEFLHTPQTGQQTAH